MDKAESLDEKVTKFDDTLKDAVVVVGRESLRHNISAELKKNGTTNILYSDVSAEVIHILKEHPLAILVLDFEMERKKVLKILESSKTPHKSEIRPIYVICNELSQDIISLTTDYNVQRVRSGEITAADIGKDIKDIYTFGGLTELAIRTLKQVSVLRSKGKWREATLKLCENLEQEPENHKIKIELSENFINPNKLDKAEELLKELTKSDSESVRIKNLQARLLMKQGKFEEAEKILRDLQIMNPDNVSRLIDLGQCMLNQTELDGANELFEKALSLDVDNKEARNGKGQVSLMQGDMDEALGFFKSSNESEVAALFNNTAVICIRKKKYDEGFQLYHTAISQVIKDPKVLSRVVFNMGLGLLKVDKTEKAKKAFKKALALDSEFEKAAHNYNILNNEGSGTAKKSKAKVKEVIKEVGSGGSDEAGYSDDFDGDFEVDDELFESL